MRVKRKKCELLSLTCETSVLLRLCAAMFEQRSHGEAMAGVSDLGGNIFYGCTALRCSRRCPTG